MFRSVKILGKQDKAFIDEFGRLDAFLVLLFDSPFVVC